MSSPRSKAAVVAVVAMTLLMTAVRTEAVNATLSAEQALDALLEKALAKVLLTLSRPQDLQEHVKGAVEAGMIDAHTLPGAADCELGLMRWATGLYKKETWALQMIDASSKLVTGVLYGNSADLGNFDECLASGPGGATDSPDDSSFTGRYALPALDLQTVTQPSELMQGSKLFKALSRMGHRSVKEYNLQEATNATFSTQLTLRIAVCVPSTCEAPVLAAALNTILIPINALLTGNGYHLQGRLPSEFTTVKGQWRKTDLSDWIVIVLCVVLALLVLVGSVVDIAINTKEKQTRDKVAVLLAFSAWTNGRRLLHIAPPSDSNFTCINGMRFLSAMWVLLGHRYRFALDVPFMNLIVIPKRVTDISVMVIASAPLSVDTFFLIGGLVNCYAFMKATSNRRSYNFIMYYVHRYVRLTPAFALMVAITATWVSLLSTGPLWYMVAGEASEKCRRNWWTALLYVANYANPNDQCMMQSWYLMADMQLHWLSPIVLVPLWRMGRVGLGWAFVVVAASCAIPFGVAYANHFRSPISTDLDSSSQDLFMRSMYYPMHTRITSYACGLLAGYLLYLIKTGQIKRRITTKQVALGWVLSFIISMTVVFGAQPLFDTENHPYNVWESSFYIGLYRLGWSVGISWVVLACILGHGGPVNALLSWTPFSVLGRLTYGIYLTHAAVQIVDVGSMRSSDYYSDFKMVERMFSDVAIASIFGACLCLTMESPIMAIEKMLRGGSGARRRRPRPPTTNGVAQEGVTNSAFVADDGRTVDDVDAEKGDLESFPQKTEPTADATTTDDATLA